MTESGTRSATGVAPIRVLVVEDQEQLRRSTMALLSEAGFDTQGALSGELAITLYAQSQREGAPFDVVLLDRTLAGLMGGVETLRLLKAIDPGVRAIMVSGSVGGEQPSEDARHGFLASLSKPVPLAELQRAIEAAVQH